MNLLSERIRWLMNNHHLTNADLAKAADVKPSSVSAWLDGKSKGLRAEVALRLSKRLEISLDWLVEGKGDPHPERLYYIRDEMNESQLKVMEEQASFQNGDVQWCTVPNGEAMFYTKEEFAKLPAKRLSSCKCVTVVDDSMSPLLYTGDRVVIDTCQNEIIFEKIYYILIDGKPMFRRLIDNVSEIIIKTFNPQNDVRLTKEEFNRRAIILGRAIDRKGPGGLA